MNTVQSNTTMVPVTVAIRQQGGDYRLRVAKARGFMNPHHIVYMHEDYSNELNERVCMVFTAYEQEITVVGNFTDVSLKLFGNHTND